jgi:hypothetical protein
MRVDPPSDFSWDAFSAGGLVSPVRMQRFAAIFTAGKPAG